MLGVLEGFAIIAVVIVAGYLLERSGVLGDGAQRVLSRTAFFVAAPCLLFTVIAAAPVTELFSPMLAIAAVSAGVAIAVGAAIAALVWRRPPAEVVVHGLAAGYLNSNNIGLPVAVYVLGSAAYTAPVLLLQVVVLMPAALLVLDHLVFGGAWSVRNTLLGSLRNPIVIGSVAGLVVALVGLHLPQVVLAPLQILGGAAVPLMLMGFGMSLHGVPALRAGSGRAAVLAASALKLVFMPFVAWIVGALVFHLDPLLLHAAVVMAALPTAQNVLNSAQRFDVAVVFARDTVLVTTVGAIPALLVISLLLAPG